VEILGVDELETELEAARLAIVSLLAVMNDEQIESVKTALEALAPMSDAAQAALAELRSSRDYRRSRSGQEHEMRRAIAAQLAMPEQSG
jgi:hypothetical protein